MHPIQKSLLKLLENKNSLPLKLRFLTREIGELHPQKIKHHLLQLQKNGLIVIDEYRKEIFRTKIDNENGVFVSLPIMGAANCGEAKTYAEDKIEGFLKVSKNLVPKVRLDELYVLVANGDSMDRTDIGGKNIESGDFVIVRKFNGIPTNNTCVVSIIDDCANIKRFFRTDDEIALISESARKYPPIFIHADDPYFIVGIVEKVIKIPHAI